MDIAKGIMNQLECDDSDVDTRTPPEPSEFDTSTEEGRQAICIALDIFISKNFQNPVHLLFGLNSLFQYLGSGRGTSVEEELMSATWQAFSRNFDYNCQMLEQAASLISNLNRIGLGDE